MKTTVFRPCVVCATGVLKCKKSAGKRTCSTLCTRMYRETAHIITANKPKNWYTKHDLPADKNKQPRRFGDNLCYNA